MRFAGTLAVLALLGASEAQAQPGSTTAVRPNPRHCDPLPCRVPRRETPEIAVRRVLDRLHTAAARADGTTYFALFTSDAVYIGTDVSERWTLQQFRAFAEPYFSSGRGWTYTLRPGTRHIQFSPDGQTVWFDEILDNASYGTTRGTGVLVRTPQGWRIAQYHLTIPMPNALANEFVARIRQGERAATPAN